MVHFIRFAATTIKAKTIPSAIFENHQTKKPSDDGINMAKTEIFIPKI